MEVDTFEEFSKLAITLFEKRPDNARFSYKYKHVKGELQLKVSDDITIITFTTDQLQDLKKMEKLSRNLMFLMQDIPLSEQPEPAQPGNIIPVPGETRQVTPGETPAPNAQEAIKADSKSSAQSSKKKKPKKKGSK